MSLLHKKEGPLKLLKNPKSTFYRIWSVFGGVSNILPISADYSLKSQIGIGKNLVGPPPSNYGEWRTGITTPKTPPVSRKGRKRKEMAREKPGLLEVVCRKSLYLRADGTGEKR